MNIYSIGNVVRLTSTFRDDDGVLADPTDVVCLVLVPGSEEVSNSTVRDSVGVYHYDLTTTVSGVYSYRFNGTGDIVAGDEAKLMVRASAFGEAPTTPTPGGRTVYIDSDENQHKIFAKDPDATLDYRFDWSTWLAGDTITDAVWACSTGILLATKVVGLTTCSAFVSGGKAGKKYLVRIRITTDSGRINDQTIKIEVHDV